jgi:hypothetical protein
MKMKIQFLLGLCIFTTPIVAMLPRREALLQTYYQITTDKALLTGTLLSVSLGAASLVSAYQGHPKAAIGFGAAATVTAVGTAEILILSPRG